MFFQLHFSIIKRKQTKETATQIFWVKRSNGTFIKFSLNMHQTFESKENFYLKKKEEKLFQQFMQGPEQKKTCCQQVNASTNKLCQKTLFHDSTAFSNLKFQKFLHPKKGQETKKKLKRVGKNFWSNKLQRMKIMKQINRQTLFF